MEFVGFSVELVIREQGVENRLALLRLPHGAALPRTGERLRLRIQGDALNPPAEGVFSVDDVLWDFSPTELERVKLYVTPEIEPAQLQ
jgi:hypothetical protein